MRKISLSLCVFFALLLSGCGKEANREGQIPYRNFSLQFSLNDPQYTSLNFNNNHVYFDGYGVKGLIVVNYAGQLYALERNCPYQPEQDCSRVTVETGGVSIRCGHYEGSNWVACCNSKFNLDGNVWEGPSKYPLRQYNVTVSNSVASISN